MASATSNATTWRPSRYRGPSRIASSDNPHRLQKSSNGSSGLMNGPGGLAERRAPAAECHGIPRARRVLKAARGDRRLKAVRHLAPVDLDLVVVVRVEHGGPG